MNFLDLDSRTGWLTKKMFNRAHDCIDKFQQYLVIISFVYEMTADIWIIIIFKVNPAKLCIEVVKGER